MEKRLTERGREREREKERDIETEWAVIYNNIKRKCAQQCGASAKLLKILSR